MAARRLRETRKIGFEPERRAAPPRTRGNDQKGGGVTAKLETPLGRRLHAALLEVLDDVRGIRPLPELTTIPKAVDVRRIRRKSGLSQARFAKRFGISVRTLQDWEQGRYRPDAMARALLTIIDREPQAAARALVAKE